MQSNRLPSVLSPSAPDSAISMERALKQIKVLLEEMEPYTEAQEDRIRASTDDVDVMLKSIDRS